MPALFLLGAVLQRSVINPVLDALPQNQILLTIGIGLVLSSLAQLAFHQRLPDPLHQLLFVQRRAGHHPPLHAAHLLLLHHRREHPRVLLLVLVKTDTRPRRPRHRAGSRRRPADGSERPEHGVTASGGLGAGGRGGRAGGAHLFYIYPQVGGAFTLKASWWWSWPGWAASSAPPRRVLDRSRRVGVRGVLRLRLEGHLRLRHLPPRAAPQAQRSIGKEPDVKALVFSAVAVLVLALVPLWIQSPYPLTRAHQWLSAVSCHTGRAAELA